MIVAGFRGSPTTLLTDENLLRLHELERVLQFGMIRDAVELMTLTADDCRIESWSSDFSLGHTGCVLRARSSPGRYDCQNDRRRVPDFSKEG
jgi:hypothetical protein